MSGNGTQGQILVVGGGISGLTTAIEASEAGCKVVLVEKNPSVGGRVAQMNQYFPKLCPPVCGLEINVRRLRAEGNIRTITCAEVEKITGEAGHYTATIRHNPRGVNEKCTNCGACAEVCPVERPNDFNYNLDKTKAIYLPFETAWPPRYAVDFKVCEGGACGKCVEACQYQAIDLEARPTTEEIEAAAVVFATGWEPYDAANIENLGFGKYPNVVTNVMLERMAALTGPTGGRIQRPSDGGSIESVAFVQCAGSRDENYLSHCSGVCCAASLKQASYIRAQYPDAQIYIFYIDIRTPGRLEDFYVARQADEKLTLIKGKVAKVEADAASGNLTVEAEDVIGGGRVRQQVGLVVLATGMVPSKIEAQLPCELVKDEHGFLVAEQAQSGLLAAGCAKRPVDVAASVRDATGTALKAIQNRVR
jgi:quinone-modifying oxidoreductase subunit QmoA